MNDEVVIVVMMWEVVARDFLICLLTLAPQTFYISLLQAGGREGRLVVCIPMLAVHCDHERLPMPQHWVMLHALPSTQPRTHPLTHTLLHTFSPHFSEPLTNSIAYCT